MSARKPSLETTARSMVRFPVNGDEDLDLAEALQLTEQVHWSRLDNADQRGNYGRCEACEFWWPCPTWVAAQYAAVEWLVAASNRLMRRSGRLSTPLPAPKPTAPVAERTEQAQGDAA